VELINAKMMPPKASWDQTIWASRKTDEPSASTWDGHDRALSAIGGKPQDAETKEQPIDNYSLYQHARVGILALCISS
jgi:hypothetical protein